MDEEACETNDGVKHRPLSLTVVGAGHEYWLCIRKRGGEVSDLCVWAEGELGYWNTDLCWLLKIMFDAGLLTLNAGALKEAGMDWLRENGVI